MKFFAQGYNHSSLPVYLDGYGRFDLQKAAKPCSRMSGTRHCRSTPGGASFNQERIFRPLPFTNRKWKFRSESVNLPLKGSVYYLSARNGNSG